MNSKQTNVLHSPAKFYSVEMSEKIKLNEIKSTASVELNDPSPKNIFSDDLEKSMPIKKEKKNSTPFGKLILLILVFVGHTSAITIFFPFLGLWIEHMSSLTKESAGTISGLLFSLYSIGQLINSFFYGRASDIVGYRKLLLFSILCNLVCSFVSGLCTSFTVLLIIRFLWGLLNGSGLLLIICLKSISQNAKDTIVFSSLRVSFNLAIIIGPFIGGLLYYDNSNYIYEYMPTLFKKLPAFLPLATLSLYNLILLLISFFYTS